MMGKRQREADALVDEESRKAPKRSAADVTAASTRTSQDLRDLLRFQQNNIDRLVEVQHTFKAFLDRLVLEHERGKPHFDALKGYLDSEPTDLLQTWSFAAETDNETLVSAVTSNIALLLRLLSLDLGLLPHGLSVAKSILAREYLKLLSRGLTAESHKESLISPCLRILTQIVSIDGGALAAQVLRERDHTFNIRFLDRNLRLFRQHGKEDRRNATVRSNTLRYIAAHIRFQDTPGKVIISSMRSVFRNIFDNLKHDPEEVCALILTTIEAGLLRDSQIPRKSKSALLSDRSLMGIVEVARRTDSDESQAAPASLDARLDFWGFLQRLCTESDLGVHLPTGWHSQPAPTDASLSNDSADLLATMRNPILFKFLQMLKPQLHFKERELMLAILRSTPELVATFILESSSRLVLAPKLTMTWISYASLLHSIIGIPVPAFFGNTSGYRQTPPAIETILENIMPAPFTAEIPTRCLNQSSTLIRFFALRILVASLRKAKVVVGMLNTAGDRYSAYLDEVTALKAKLMARLPPIGDVSTAFRAVHENDRLAKEAAAHTLVLYQEVLPTPVTEDNFDYATPLATVLNHLEGDELCSEDRALLELQLTHLLELARLSPGTRWWQRHANLAFSPFTTILKLCASGLVTSSIRQKLMGLLHRVVKHGGFLQMTTSAAALDGLVASLEPYMEWSASQETWTFLDDCIARYVKRPIKYGDDMEEIVNVNNLHFSPTSPLLMVIVEQAPFVERIEPEHRDQVITWIARYLTAMKQVGEDSKVLKAARSMIKSNFKVKSQTIRPIAAVKAVEVTRSDSDQTYDAGAALPEDGQPQAFTPVTPESSVHPELMRHKKQDADELVHDGTLEALMLDLCSDYPEVRKQAMTALEECSGKLQSSSLDAKEQIWLLVSELVETARASVDQHPLSYVAASFARAALAVVLEPTHFFYGAVARYLIKDPYWNVRKLPAYFLRRVLLDEEPAEDDRYWDQIAWVLGVLLDGLRKPQDVRILYANDNVELILEITGDVHVTPQVASLVVQLVQRAVAVDGARNLTMNSALLPWIEQCLRRANDRSALPKGLLGALRAEVQQAVEQDERVKEWSHGFHDERANVTAVEAT